MIVVDSIIIRNLYFGGQQQEQAKQVLRKDPERAAPLLWRSEFRSVLTLHVRMQWLTLEAAQQLMDEAIRLMAGREHDVVSSQVFRLAAMSFCSACDFEYVALAHDLSVPLVTVRKQILEDFPRVAVSPETYLASRSK